MNTPESAEALVQETLANSGHKALFERAQMDPAQRVQAAERMATLSQELTQAPDILAQLAVLSHHAEQAPNAVIPMLDRVALRTIAWSSDDLGLHTVTRLDDLRAPPGNRLEALSGSQEGRYSIRVNRQWRLTFTWTDNSPHNVFFEDYH